MVQWLRIHLPMQGTRVRALVWEDSHMPWGNYARVPQLLSLRSRACEPQLLKPEPRARAPQQEKPPR